jgi:hypothetical protein
MGQRTNLNDFLIVETNNSYDDHKCWYGNALCGTAPCCGHFFCSGCENSNLFHDGVLGCCNQYRIDLSYDDGEYDGEYNEDEEHDSGS